MTEAHPTHPPMARCLDIQALMERIALACGKGSGAGTEDIINQPFLGCLYVALKEESIAEVGYYMHTATLLRGDAATGSKDWLTEHTLLIDGQHWWSAGKTTPGALGTYLEAIRPGHRLLGMEVQDYDPAEMVRRHVGLANQQTIARLVVEEVCRVRAVHLANQTPSVPGKRRAARV